MDNEKTDVDEKEIEEMRKYLDLQVNLGILEPFTEFHPELVKESEFGDTLGSRNIIYLVELNSGNEVYAVDGGFLLDPETGHFSNQGDPQRFKAVYSYAPNEDLADKLHLYTVARICEREGTFPEGEANNLADTLGISTEYRDIAPHLIRIPEDPTKN